MGSGRCERKKRNFWVVGRKFLGLISSVGSVSRCRGNEGESEAAIVVVGGPYFLRNLLGLLSVRHL